jgi:hypothetical protein
LNSESVISGSAQVSIIDTTGYSTFSSSISSSIGSLSGSVATTTLGTKNRVDSIEAKTGSYATTGSNIFVGSQVITGSLYITSDMVVQGCSCLQNITASAVSIGTNTVMLNTATPAVRFAGISVQDSGSNAGVTGSIYWDGLCNRWIYSNPSNVGYSGGMILSGPRNLTTIGNESSLTCNYIAKSGGGDHLYDSCIYEMSGSVGINCSTPSYNLDVNGCGRFTGVLRVDHSTASGYGAVIYNTCTTGQGLTIRGGSTSSQSALVVQPYDGSTTLLNILSTGTATFSGCVIASSVGLGTTTPVSLLSAYNTTSTALLQMYISNAASNGTGGGNRGFDTSFTSTVTSFTGTDNGDQGYGYFPVAIVNGQTYTIHFKSTAVNGTLGTIITSTGTNFATDAVQTISLPTITDSALTSIRFTATGTATYIGFAGYRTSGTMSLTISEVSIVSGIPDIETGAIVAYKGIATNRINIQAPTTACIPALGCADCTTGLVISNFDTRYGMLLGTLNTGTGWIQQARYDGTATAYGLSLNPNGGNVGIGTTSPNLSGGASGTNVLTISATSSARNALLELNGTRTNSTDVTGYIRFFNNSAATPIADIRALRGSSDTWGDLAFTTCDTERMRIGSTGNVGIDATTTYAKLHIGTASNNENNIFFTRQTTTACVIIGGLRSSLGPYWGDATSTSLAEINLETDNPYYRGAISFRTNNSDATANRAVERMRISSSGLVSINTTTSAATLNLKAQSNCRAILFKNANDGDGSLWLYGASNTIDYSFSTYSVGNAFYLYNNGNYSFAGSNVSDRRLKENIEVINYNATEKLMQLVPKSYNMIKHSDIKRSGFIAQEVKEILPDLITGTETNEEYLGLDYNGLLSIAIKSIQEQQSIIQCLTNRIEQLENK